MATRQTSLSALVTSLAGQIALINGPPGTNKTILCHRWIIDGLKSGESAVIVCVRTTAKHILNELDRIEPMAKYLKSGTLRFIDLVAARDPSPEKSPNTVILQSVTDLMGLSAELDVCSRNAANIRFLIDTVSFLMLYNNSAFVIDVLQTAAIRVASRNQNMLILNQEGVLESSIYSTLEALATTVFETAVYEVDGKPTPLVRVKFGPTKSASNWVEIK